MTFIADDQKEPEEAEKTPPKTEEPQKGKTGGSPLNSLIFLILIGVALFYARDFLSGEKDIPGLSEIITSDKAESNTEPTAELQIPRVKENDLKQLIAEFKTEYEKIHPKELLVQTRPKLTRIRYSDDRKSLLIVLEKMLPSSGVLETQEIIYNTDDFGRLVTTGDFSKIKLYPEEE